MSNLLTMDCLDARHRDCRSDACACECHTEAELPPPCAPGLHKPAIIHRCGGKDASFYNVCGVCGREIERGDGEPWATQQQIDEYIAEQVEENRHESGLEEWEALHPEARCPTRE